MWSKNETIIGLALAVANKGTPSTPSSFKTTALAVNPAEVYPGKEVIITARVTNTSDSESTYVAGLSLDDEAVAARKITFAAGESKIVSFAGSLDNQGIYKVTWTEIIGEIQAPRLFGELAVVAYESTQSSDSKGTTTNVCK